MAFIFKVQIKGITKPPVWRRLAIPDTFTFEQFHYAIQHAFNWYNAHLFSFSPSGIGSSYEIQIPYGGPEDTGWGEIKDAQKLKLKTLFKEEKQTFIYTYDFGDNWEHKITLEKLTPEKISKPSCLTGKGKRPPEDCGGVWGYQDFLETVNNPQQPEYEETREWALLAEGEEWDVREFDIEKVNTRLERGKYY